MLDIPDELFGSSFSMVTNISKIFGDVITVSSQMGFIDGARSKFNKKNIFRFLRNNNRIQHVVMDNLCNISNRSLGKRLL